MSDAPASLNPSLLENPEKKGAREGFGRGLVEAGEANEAVVALTGDLADSTKVGEFRDRFPDRFFQVGVAEQNMMGIAAGLALSGKIPFASSYATFSPGRNWDQLRVSVAYSGANVKVVGAHAGLSVGPDGATHQALEDIAIVRVLPGMTVVVPCDYEEARRAVHALVDHRGPSYLRFGRSKTAVVTTAKTPFQLGRAEIFRNGSDIAIIACGTLVFEALLAANQLASVGIAARVINCHTVKPLDRETVVAAARECGVVLTAEEHQVTGGLGGAVAELLAQTCPVPMDLVGMPDSFGESGTPDELFRKWGLSADHLVARASLLVKKKTNVDASR